MSNTLPAGKYIRVPINEATAAPPQSGRYVVYRDRWWLVTSDDCILFYKPSRHSTAHPQCNENQKITEAVRDKIHPERDVRYLEVVYVPASL